MNFLKKLWKPRKILITHDQGFHADDVFAYAILQEVLSKRGECWKLIRTRDDDVIKTGDIVFDVGNIYDAEKNRFDHHQAERAGQRENGVMYASAGLIWKHFGREICSTDDVWQSIDRSLIQELDATDSGQNYIGTINFPDAGYTSMAIHIANIEPDMFTQKTPALQKFYFEKAAMFARGILSRMIASKEVLEKAFQEASIVYQHSSDKSILVFEKNYERPTWKRIAEFPEPIFVVYPNRQAGGWKIESVPVQPTTMESRKLLPESWRGLRKTELAEITGVSDAEFCHPSGFLMGTKTKESAIALAKKALEN